MLHRLTDLIPKGAAPHIAAVPVRANGVAPTNAKPTYAKVFRYAANAEGPPPQRVEIIGSFTQWLPVPLMDHGAQHWQANIENIESHKTHHYMLLVDGQPAPYPNSDGYAVPQGEQEQQFALPTARGPRLYMLFAQTK